MGGPAERAAAGDPERAEEVRAAEEEEEDLAAGAGRASDANLATMPPQRSRWGAPRRGAPTRSRRGGPRYPPRHPYYHSSRDTPRWVDFDLLAEDATASAFTAFRLASG